MQILFCGNSEKGLHKERGYIRDITQPFYVINIGSAKAPQLDTILFFMSHQ